MISVPKKAIKKFAPKAIAANASSSSSSSSSSLAATVTASTEPVLSPELLAAASEMDSPRMEVINIPVKKRAVTFKSTDLASIAPQAPAAPVVVSSTSATTAAAAVAEEDRAATAAAAAMVMAVATAASPSASTVAVSDPNEPTEEDDLLFFRKTRSKAAETAAQSTAAASAVSSTSISSQSISAAVSALRAASSSSSSSSAKSTAASSRKRTKTSLVDPEADPFGSPSKPVETLPRRTPSSLDPEVIAAKKERSKSKKIDRIMKKCSILPSCYPPTTPYFMYTVYLRKHPAGVGLVLEEVYNRAVVVGFSEAFLQEYASTHSSTGVNGISISGVASPNYIAPNDVIVSVNNLDVKNGCSFAKLNEALEWKDPQSFLPHVSAINRIGGERVNLKQFATHDVVCIRLARPNFRSAAEYIDAANRIPSQFALMTQSAETMV